MNQQIRFCTTTDGVRLAYALSGSGAPLVKAGHWLTNIERDWSSPVWRHWMKFLSAEHTLVRYDERGSGLSDRGTPHLSLDDWVGDLETVIDAAGLERFDLLGISQGGPVAIAYAARHPERVSNLVLYGTYARGRLHRAGGSQAEAEALVTLTRNGWGQPNPAFRRLFTTLFIPGGTDVQIAWLDDLQKVSTSAEHAARSRQVRYTIDVTALASSLTMRTLVMHARSDALVPLEEGRHLGSLIPGARFVSLESSNHILLEEEPAWEEFRSQLRAFLPIHNPTPESGFEMLTDRERQVLALVADGHDNASIAATLHLSIRTVERHLSNSYTKLKLTGKAARAAAAARFAIHSRTQ